MRALRQLLKGLVLAAVGAAAGFAASLLRQRPATSYATSLRQPAPDSDRNHAE